MSTAAIAVARPIGIELVREKETKIPAQEERDQVIQRAFRKGLLILGAGPNTIRIAPPLIVSREQADIAMQVLEECIRETGSARN